MNGFSIAKTVKSWLRPEPKESEAATVVAKAKEVRTKVSASRDRAENVLDELLRKVNKLDCGKEKRDD